MLSEVTPAEVWVSLGTVVPVPQQLKLPLSLSRNECGALLCSASPGRAVSSLGCILLTVVPDRWRGSPGSCCLL